MNRRIVKFSKFRNLGLKEEARLILNYSLKKEEIGDLVVVIGPNNSGKSNVLSGLHKIHGNISDFDITTLSMKEQDRNPSILLSVIDETVWFEEKVIKNDKKFSTNLALEEITVEKIKEELDKMIKSYERYELDTRSLIDAKRGGSKKTITDEVFNEIERLIRYANDYDKYRTSSYKSYHDVKEECEGLEIFRMYYIQKSKENPSRLIKNYIKNKYGYTYNDEVIEYKEKTISQNDLYCSRYDYIEASVFFVSLFKALNYDAKELKNAYEQFSKFHNKSILRRVEADLRERMVSINKMFNDMYFSRTNEYEFSISLDSEEITFDMALKPAKEEYDIIPIMYDQQSIGFKWFFNFYFNFICLNQLKVGDIVVIDEPATNLHVKGQRELRKFIKEFAIQNGITFVISTHSPFLIDVDNLDELRIVSAKDGEAKIENIFSACSIDDIDTLLPIKESLTIEQHVLYNNKSEVVWVEGITDYCYLTMFKRLFREENIYFLPFNGVGKDDKKQKEILERLCAIDFRRRNIILDADSAGMAMKKNCHETVFNNAILISDLDEKDKKFIEIEDLFSKRDREKYQVLKEGSDIHKKAASAIILKKTAKVEDFSEETINNFKRLFKLIKGE